MASFINIKFERHAAVRLIERALDANLDLEETKRRIKLSLTDGRTSWKHRSRHFTTNCRYFQDNFTFYVIWTKKKDVIWIKTVIIEHGRP
jgi:hypothetical protein